MMIITRDWRKNYTVSYLKRGGKTALTRHFMTVKGAYKYALRNSMNDPKDIIIEESLKEEFSQEEKKAYNHYLEQCPEENPCHYDYNEI
jgi:hypothetical protein